MKIVEVFFQNSKPRGGGAMSKWDPKNYFLIIELSIQEIFCEADRFDAIIFEVRLQKGAISNVRKAKTDRAEKWVRTLSGNNKKG